MNHVVQTQALSKQFRQIKAVNELSISVPQGSVYGILGPNGSGKTTSLAMLLGVTTPDSGSFDWFGRGANADTRRSIGTLLETPNFYPYLSGEENLRITAAIRGIDNSHIETALANVDLLERGKSAFKTYSLGMKQRLALAAATLGSPKVLVLDEPTNGLDPLGIADVREFIRAQAEAGVTVILASHILDEVEKVCTHVAVLNKGKLLVEGRISDVLGRMGSQTLEIAALDNSLLADTLKTHPQVQSFELGPAGVLVVQASPDMLVSDFSRFLAERKVYPTHLVQRKQSLESQFLELVKEDQ